MYEYIINIQTYLRVRKRDAHLDEIRIRELFGKSVAIRFVYNE